MLPCQHRFHMECIDQWLSSRKPLCPICKWDALEEFMGNVADVEQGEGEQPQGGEVDALQTRQRRSAYSLPL